MLQKGSQITLTVDRMGSSGEGIGSFEGLVVFVEGALPGEEVEAVISLSKKTYAKATLKKILKASEFRTEPSCGYYERCGGCQLMHLEYAQQLVMKSQRVRDAFERIGGFQTVEVDACVASSDPLGYRNKIQLPVTQKGMGLYARGTNDLIPIKHCQIHCKAGEKVYSTLRTLLSKSKISRYDKVTGKGELRHVLIRTAIHSGKVLVTLVGNGKPSSYITSIAKDLMAMPRVAGVVHNGNTRRDNVILGKHYSTLVGEDHIWESINGLEFKVSSASFFQVNPSQSEALYKSALEMAELTPESRALDAYCGVGTLSLQIAKKAKTVVGIESVSEAIDDARSNASRNGIENCKFLCGEAEKLIADVKEVDVAFVNPPRKGCDKSFLEGLSKLQPKRIVYISCDPATLARDCAVLAEKGYKLNQVRPHDMFPQTAHVETVVNLVLA